jgi:predicted ATPase/DNA-binding XRE family transcriptional regulator
MDGPQSFGQWLRHRRRELDLTQDALARQVGCARVTIRKLEADEIRPSRQLAELLATQLGVPPQEREQYVRFGRGGLPPMRVTAQARHNLPVHPNKFIGRERELAAIRQALQQSRLVTLAGPGGIGKTRLALATAGELLNAHAYPDGVWWVELAALQDPALVAQAVAKAAGVREIPRQPLVETLAEAFQPQRVFLVLDNCEHLVAACVRLADALLQQGQGVRLLATSRERLNLRGEVVWQVPALSLPAHQPNLDSSGVAGSEAIRLFAERAAAVLPAFRLSAENLSAVAEICTRLDGMPLAIELAAAWVRSLSVAQIAARLSNAFRLLTRGSQDAPLRQQTLRATMDWSYDLLPEEERCLFQRLAVFSGSFSLDALEAIAGDPLATEDVLGLLSILLDKSLVTLLDWQVAGQARYRLLEPVRQYALEKLQASGDEPARRARHLAFFLELSRQAGPQLDGAEQAAWLDRLEADLDNLGAAIDWAPQHGQTQAALQIAGSLRRLWFIRSHDGEGIERLHSLLVRPDASAPTSARLIALNAYLMLIYRQYDLRDVKPLIAEALALASALDDRWHKAFALLWAGNGALSDGEAVAARVYLEQSLALWEELGDRLQPGWTLLFLGEVALYEGQTESAKALFSASVPPLRAAVDPPTMAIALRRLGQLGLAEGDWAGARNLIIESLQSNWQLRDYRGTAACLAALGAVHMSRAELSEAAHLFGCVATFQEFIHTSLILYDQQQYEQNTRRLRTQLDASAFGEAWNRGHALTREQAVELALQP